MEGIEFGLLMLGVLLVLIAFRIPIAIAMIAIGMVGYMSISGWSTLLNYLNTAAYWRFSTYDLSVVPLFLLMGQFATRAGMSKALFDAANVFVTRPVTPRITCAFCSRRRARSSRATTCSAWEPR